MDVNPKPMKSSSARSLAVGSIAAAALALVGGALSSSAWAQNSQGPAQAPTPAQTQSRPKTLDNSGDPTLALTGPLRGSGVAPAGSAPPNPDPRNLEGVWWLKGYEYMLGPAPGIEPPLKPEYMDILKRRIRAKNAGKPETDTSTQCFPHGMPRLMESPYPIEIVQTPGRVTILHEVAHEVRRFYLDQKQPEHLPITYLGHSVAHWEGDTLVVDTMGINASSFIDDEGSSHSDKEHIVERFHKIDGGRQLEVDTTVEDPVTLEHPYSYKRFFQWRPDVRPQEYVCEENNRNAPVNGVTVAQ
jgi:hypothetical protein